MRLTKLSLIALTLFVALALPAAAQSLQHRESTWDTDFGSMTLVQEGPLVWGTYEYHDGQVIGALQGGTLYGFWWEDDFEPGTGPGDQWCGPLIFTFDAKASSFKGAWGAHENGVDSFAGIDGSQAWTGSRTAGTFDPAAR
jgi:hypothetical protein